MSACRETLNQQDIEGTFRKQVFSLAWGRRSRLDETDPCKLTSQTRARWWVETTATHRKMAKTRVSVVILCYYRILGRLFAADPDDKAL